MIKKIVAVMLAALVVSEGIVPYAAEGQTVFAKQEQEISASEPQEMTVEEQKINEVEKSGTLDGAIYWSVENDILTITNHGSSRAIPDYKNEYKAPWNGESANSIKEVVISSGITGIGEYAFYGMQGLRKVTIHSNELTSVGAHAFEGCKKLREINLPDTLNEMGIYAFAQCTMLNKISEEGFVTPESLTEIPEYAFAKCGSITNVTFSKNVQVIEACAFYNCGGLKTMNFQDASLKTISDYAFASSGLESVIIPDGIQKIDAYAFYDCNSLKSFGIRAENSLTYIGTGAFERCSNLTGFYVMAGSYAENYAKEEINLSQIYQTYKYMANDRKDNYKIQTSGNTTYTGKEIRPKVTITMNDVTLQEGVDYTLSYNNNINAGNRAKITITGINRYYGTMEQYFTINPLDISLGGIVSDIKSQIYTGKEIKPNVVITVNGVTLVKEKDYTISYQNNVKVGKKAEVIVTGKGSYTGKIQKYFTIAASLSKAKVTVKKQAYTGKNLKPGVTVVLNGTKLVEGTDYKVTYSNNKKVGKNAKVTIKGMGTYSGKVTKKFTIAPPKPKVKVNGKKLKITNYQNGADIYLTYSTNVNGTKKSGKLLWQAKTYKKRKCVDLTKFAKKYQNGKLTLTITMKINSIESAPSKKVTVE